MGILNKLLIKTVEDEGKRVECIRLTNCLALLFLLIYGMIFLWSSWYIVGEKDMATIRTLGVHTDTVGPGMHGKMPYPISKAVKTNVTEYHRMEIGFRTESSGPPAVYLDVPEESLMLTGDGNIAGVEFVMQYRISDPGQWQFGFEEPEKLLNYLAQSGMRLIVGQSNFDAVTTSGRSDIQEKVKSEVQMMCTILKLGVEISRVNIQDALPPGPVGLAFKDVNNAKTDKERFINEGIAHRNDVVPKAQGEASEIVNLATGEAAKRLLQATGEMDRWLKVWVEYKKNPEVIKQKLSFETAPFVLRGGRVVVDGSGQGVLKHLGLNNLMGDIQTVSK